MDAYAAFRGIDKVLSISRLCLMTEHLVKSNYYSEDSERRVITLIDDHLEVVAGWESTLR